jgi:CBS domain-containing protein/anti-sigma regulatory factor (Ser/Thr protein kinase)
LRDDLSTLRPTLPASEPYKAEELIYELKIADVMTRRLITIGPGTAMREVKQILRDRRISGLPVLVDNRLAGIVSIEDVIVAMERGQLDTAVAECMTTRVHTIRQEETAVTALNTFAQVRVGRLPVVDETGALVGIITPDDITRGVLKALQNAYHEEEVRRYRVSHVFEDMPSDRTSVILRYEVAARDFDAAGRASSQLKHTLRRLGIDPRIVRRIAIASYEAEMNLVIHTSQGGSLVAEVTSEFIALLTVDTGPGIEDVKRALQPGFSTAPDWIREMGFGAGMGLSNIQNCTDEMHVDSQPGRGTRLTAIVYLAKEAHETAPDTAITAIDY